jgi:hypothetical protein
MPAFGLDRRPRGMNLALLRATVNAEFAELISANERLEQHRFQDRRLAAEPDNSFRDQASTQIKHMKQ